MKGRILLAVLVAVALAACAPKLRPLGGEPVIAPLPRTALKPGHHRIVFRWELEDRDLVARGEGAARVASPDSARLDFFLGGGAGGGAAMLIGDRLTLSDQGDIVRRVVPPAPLLWAALGRLSVAGIRDTVARRVGDTVRADLGTPVVWRVTFVRDTLRRLERVEDGRVLEWVQRFDDGGGARLRYRHETGRRQLELVVTRTDSVSAFDPAIWVLH